MQKFKALRIIRKVRQDYNTIAKEWDVSRGRGPSGIKLKALKLVKRDMKVLDIGCGNGLIIPEVLRRGGQYYGIDLSNKLAGAAKRRFRKEIKEGKAEIKIGNALDLPYESNYFDVVFIFAVFHHIPSAELRLQFLKELRRVLKPGGSGAVIVWNLLNEWADKRFGILEQLKKSADPSLGDVSVQWNATPGKNVKRYMHMFSKKELSELAKKAGFSKFSVEFYTRMGKKEANGEEEVLELWK